MPDLNTPPFRTSPPLLRPGGFPCKECFTPGAVSALAHFLGFCPSLPFSGDPSALDFFLRVFHLDLVCFSSEVFSFSFAFLFSTQGCPPKFISLSPFLPGRPTFDSLAPPTRHQKAFFPPLVSLPTAFFPLPFFTQRGQALPLVQFLHHS